MNSSRRSQVAGLFRRANFRRSSDSSATFRRRLAGASGLVGTGFSRHQVAYALLASQEYRTNLVFAGYDVFLHRPADPSGTASWVADLNAGMTDEQLIASLTSSPEYYSDATS